MKGLNPGDSHFISRSSMISRVNIFLNRTGVTDISTTCALVIFSVKVSVTVNNLTTVLFRIMFTQTINSTYLCNELLMFSTSLCFISVIKQFYTFLPTIFAYNTLL